MPLVSSPIDGSPMRQVNRYGIEIDVCPTTGGIWLDKGELEKLMALLKEEAASDNVYAPAGFAPRYVSHDMEKRHSRKHHDDDDHYRGQHHRKSKMSKMMDIFDF